MAAATTAWAVRLQGEDASSRVRNVCILAHVDHGKTTLADALVASNGIISNRLAGQLRYLDSRKDEQERGITMKSSAVSLAFAREPDGDRTQHYLVNLIDTPGHVDFASEVSTAIRLCDGCLVVVDVVEGVQPQTKAVLYQAWQAGIRPVLVLNKIDRMFVETKLSPEEIYYKLNQVLEAVNAVIGELFAADVMESKLGAAVKDPGESAGGPQEGQQLATTTNTFDWSTGLDEADDSDLYFAPDRGNVIFASAADGWGFTLGDFARIYSQKLGFSEAVLRRTLWGDFFVKVKSKKIQRGAQANAKKPLFVQLVLENLQAVYGCVTEGSRDDQKLDKIVKSLNLANVNRRDLLSANPKARLSAVFSAWLPLARTALGVICDKLPAPNDLSKDRVRKLMCPDGVAGFDLLPEETRRLEEHFLRCSSSDEDPVIVFVSKMFPFSAKQLPENRPKPLTAEELARRREEARKRHQERLALAAQQGEALRVEDVKDASGVTPSGGTPIPAVTEEADAKGDADSLAVTFIAFARVFSGNLKAGKEVYVLGPKHDPERALARLKGGQDVCGDQTSVHDFGKLAVVRDKGNEGNSRNHIMKATVGSLYMFLGRDLELLDQAKAGSVVGIGGLSDFILKSATLSSEIACPPFAEVSKASVPIMRVAVEPGKSSDLSRLVQGLHLLDQADANVQVELTDKGEHILVTAGQVHLERCVRDLAEEYAKGVEVVTSAPIVPFRETIIEPPSHDMVNEEVAPQDAAGQDPLLQLDQGQERNPGGVVELQTPDKQCLIRMSAIPLPAEAVKVLDDNLSTIKRMSSDSNRSFSLEDQVEVEAVAKFRSSLQEALKSSPHPEIQGCVDKIWSFGPKRCGPNLLIKAFVHELEGRSVWKSRQSAATATAATESNPLQVALESSFLSGFQLATLAGPLCDEPMMGVAFVATEWNVTGGPAKPSEENLSSSEVYGPLSGQVVSTVKECCRRAFQSRPQRLVAAMYSCDIQVKSEVLGKMYAVLGKRRGRIVKEEMIEGSSTFVVTAHVPVVESLNFAETIRKQTSGLAQPQLVFSHWETIDIDPFWIPRTREEILHFGDKADSENQARAYMNEVRKRKGLAIDEKIVEFATKQRTLTKTK